MPFLGLHTGVIGLPAQGFGIDAWPSYNRRHHRPYRLCWLSDRGATAYRRPKIAADARLGRVSRYGFAVFLKLRLAVGIKNPDGPTFRRPRHWRPAACHLNCGTSGGIAPFDERPKSRLYALIPGGVKASQALSLIFPGIFMSFDLGGAGELSRPRQLRTNDIGPLQLLSKSSSASSQSY
jgi:hypothetical protein